ncbi:MAG TPA: transposase [Terriglobales bacterium]|nr:transposase [Terriglobales bacterium]
MAPRSKEVEAETVYLVDHAVKCVDGRVPTNTLENVWSLVKRGLHGTDVSVEPFHLFRYLDEQKSRFNNRKDIDDGKRFKLAMSQVMGKRLTYAQLTGKGTDSLHHETTGAGETQIPFLSLSARLDFIEETVFGFFFFACPITAVFGTLNSAFIPRLKFASASGPSTYSGSFME